MEKKKRNALVKLMVLFVRSFAIQVQDFAGRDVKFNDKNNFSSVKYKN
jgi:hypothetical protein